MTFVQAIQSGFRNFVYFDGRASRSEFWWWMLFAFVVQWAFDRLAIWLWLSERSPDSVSELISTLAALALLLPSLAVTARRLHDIDRTGWWQLLWVIPIIGWIVLLYWATRPGTPGDNRFGPDPLVPSAPAPASA